MAQSVRRSSCADYSSNSCWRPAMADIIIPEARLEEFLRSLLVQVTKVQQELVAEMRADVEASKALFHARLEEALARRTRAAEEELERKLCAAEEEIEKKLRAT